jgi:putative sigma-54 modulation protein
MNVSIVGKQFELTDSIKAHVDSAISTLDKYNLDIISIKAIMTGDERNGKKGFASEFAINLPNKNTVVIKQKDKDIYAAVDLAIDRAQKVLRRHSDKIRDHKAVKATEILSNQIVESCEQEIETTNDIVPMELGLYKPTEIEDALNELKENEKQQFHVFYDMDEKLRVIYKREDGKFGLY